LNKDASNEGEWVAITILNVEKKKIGWSPKLKKSVYINESIDPQVIDKLKRIREVDMVTAYDQQRDRTLYIELKDPERKQLDTIYSQYLEAGGQVLYSQKKKGRKTHTLFMLDERCRQITKSDIPEKRSLFE
jgi:hypothetical protein